MKTEISIIVLVMTLIGCISNKDRNNIEIIYLIKSNSNIDTAHVTLQTIMNNKGKSKGEIFFIENCECRKYNDTTFIYIYGNTNHGFTYNSINIKLSNSYAETWFERSNDIGSNIYKISKLNIEDLRYSRLESDRQIKIPEISINDLINGDISLEFDTTINNSYVNYKIIGKFNCKIEEITTEWYKFKQMNPHGQLIFQ